MVRVTSIFGYTAAALTIAVTALTPFVLMGSFTRGVAAIGIHPDPVYTGGEPARTVVKDRYRIIVNQPVRPGGWLNRTPPFVQLTWTPVRTMPIAVSDAIDLDGDGAPDLRVSFSLPGAADQANLRARVQSLNPAVASRVIDGKESFAALIAPIGDGIVVRVPLRDKPDLSRPPYR